LSNPVASQAERRVKLSLLQGKKQGSFEKTASHLRNALNLQSFSKPEVG
jgi:hypothetical protein